VLSLFPLGSHRVSATVFVNLSEAADGTRTAEAGTIRRYPDGGDRMSEQWYLGDLFHRQDAPAWEQWDSEGRLVMRAWWVRGVPHREDAPAQQHWDPESKVLWEEWWRRGTLLRGHASVAQRLA
jgi:hypothetical protein